MRVGHLLGVPGSFAVLAAVRPRDSGAMAAALRPGDSCPVQARASVTGTIQRPGTTRTIASLPVTVRPAAAAAAAGIAL